MLPSLPPLSSSAAVGLQASAYTITLGSLQACRRCPLETSQTKISPLPPLPLPPLASRVPSGLHATPSKEVSTPSGSRKRCTSAPVVVSHTRTALSHPLVARNFPSGLHATPYTVQRWPRSTLGGFLPAPSQMVGSRSEPALAS